MRCDDLTPEQSAAMAETLARHARYLSRIVERMHKLGWPADDVLYVHTTAARDAMMSLVVTVHKVKAENAKPAWIRANSASR